MTMDSEAYKEAAALLLEGWDSASHVEQVVVSLKFWILLFETKEITAAQLAEALEIGVGHIRKAVAN